MQEALTTVLMVGSGVFAAGAIGFLAVGLYSNVFERFIVEVKEESAGGMSGAGSVVVRKLDMEYARLLAGERVAVEADWKWRVGLLGRQVVIDHPGGDTTTGRLRDMAFDGLEVENSDGFVRVVAPEAVSHIRPQA